MGVFWGRDAFSIATQLRELRERAGLSLDEMAHSLGFRHASSIEQYEDEEKNLKDYLPVEFTEKIARVLVGHGKPSIRTDEVWALASPDARVRLLADRKAAFDESVTVRIPSALVTGQLAANIMEMAAANSAKAEKKSADKKTGRERKRTNIQKTSRKKKENHIKQARENSMKTHYQPVLMDEPMKAFDEDSFSRVEDNLVDFVKDRFLPVYGQDVAGEHGEFDLNGNVMFEVACPPQLNQSMDAYAVEVSGETMWPRYRDGEIVYCDPCRRVKKGDFVVAQVIEDENATTTKAFVKMFSHHNEKELVLEQFNPPQKLVFPHDKVVSVHTITLSGDAV
ncbi:S24 family peptidase [uncultured Bartonella sp.]|uniref:S24 family peptidase n=1 Tax=uncultured Bartonella sp. TaxID=104108 RepID=UPI0025F561D5|nr:S24 family peptidase [uncultured Bartonella sp.]